MPKRKKPGLTARQRQLLKELSKGKAQGDAAVAAGYSPTNPNQSGYQAMKQIARNAPELLAAHGLTDDSLIHDYLLPMMNADETKFFPHHVVKGKKQSFKIDTRTVKAWNPRKEGLDMAFKIRGLYVREAENKGPEFTVLVIDGTKRPDWKAMRRALPSPPGIEGAAKVE